MSKKRERKVLAGAMLLLSAMSWCPANAQCDLNIEGKSIYIPNDLKDNDFTCDSSQWSYCRMATSENFVVFWQKGFGKDLSEAPELDGNNMKVDLPNLIDRLEDYYAYYRDTLKFVLPGSKSEKYRMMVMLNYSLEGTAYGGDYDGEIGALWIAPNRVQDKKLNCIAHELGHSFQSQVGADGAGISWGGGGIFEMASQWMLWQVNPEWVTDENYHWEGFKKQIHLPFLAGENIYHSPYVLEYWSMKHGKTVIADLFREGKRGEDPAQTYMRKFGLSLDDFATEALDCYSRLITFDFPRVKESHRKYACELSSEMVKIEASNINGKKYKKGYAPVNAPQRYGFNVVELPVPAKGKSVSVKFNAVGEDLEDKGYAYKIVTVDANGDAQYSEASTKQSGKLTFRPSGDTDTKKAYLVVVGYPTKSYGNTTMNPYERRGKAPKKQPEYKYIVEY